MTGEADGGGVRELLVGDRYRLGELLGVGGTATVFRAVDTRARSGDAESRRTAIAAPLAVKLMHEHLAEDETQATAFLTTAELTRGIAHPALCAPLDLGHHDAGGLLVPWLAMPYAPGRSLADVVATFGPLDPSDALRVIADVLDALDALHSLGLVHRDLTPANIVVNDDPDGTGPTVRLIDLGLVAHTGQSATTQPDPGTETDAGLIVGSARYLSPEHAQGLPVGTRGDVYQVGAVLYFLLTGRPPYTRRTVEQVLEAHVSAPPPIPSASREDVPVAVDRLVATAMSKTARGRYADAAAMRSATETVLRAVTGSETSEWEGTEILAASSGSGTDRVSRTAATVAFAAAPNMTSRRVAAYLDREPADAAQAVGTAAIKARDTRGAGWILGTVVIAVMITVGVVAASRAGETGVVAEPTPSVTPSPSVSAPGPEHEPEPSIIEPVRVDAPAIPEFGADAADAERILREAGYDVHIAREPSPHPADTVLGSNPASGQPLSIGDTITLILASGSNHIPDVTGMGQDAAIEALHQAGFRASVFFVADPAPAGQVLSSQPAAPGLAVLASEVVLRLADGSPPAAPPTQPSTPPATPGPTDPPASEDES
ncbi:Stk1 family PASTA domain-containing Ser/Thr kinase [Okibacterium endophyticum]